MRSGLTTESALVKMRLSERPPTGAEDYSYLQKVWEQEKMQSFLLLLALLQLQNIVPTLEAMQKLVEFYHNKALICSSVGVFYITSPTCLHTSTSAKCHPFTESDKDLLSKVREDMLGGPSIVFTRKAVIDKTHIRKSRNAANRLLE